MAHKILVSGPLVLILRLRVWGQGLTIQYKCLGHLRKKRKRRKGQFKNLVIIIQQRHAGVAVRPDHQTGKPAEMFCQKSERSNA